MGADRRLSSITRYDIRKFQMRRSLEVGPKTVNHQMLGAAKGTERAAAGTEAWPGPDAQPGANRETCCGCQHERPLVRGAVRYSARGCHRLPLQRYQEIVACAISRLKPTGHMCESAPTSVRAGVKVK